MGSNASIFSFRGGDNTLDFVNTTCTRGGIVKELLVTPTDLLGWLTAADRLTGEDAVKLEAQPTPRALMAQVLELREALRAIFQALVDRVEPYPDALTVLNRWLAEPASPAATGKLRYIQTDTGPAFELTAPTIAPSWHGILPELARQAAKLLTSDELPRLRRCENSACVIYFLDTSRNGKRRWCSMDTCGNRHKVAAHYRRARENRAG